MASTKPFMVGKNFKAKFFLDGSAVVLDIESIDVKANVTEINEGILGEDRDRLQAETNFFEISLTCKVIDTAVVEAVIKNTSNDDAKVEPLSKDFALIAQPNNGLTKGFTAREICIGAWGLSIPKRTELVSFTLPLRARYFETI